MFKPLFRVAPAEEMISNTNGAVSLMEFKIQDVGRAGSLDFSFYGGFNPSRGLAHFSNRNVRANFTVDFMCMCTHCVVTSYHNTSSRKRSFLLHHRLIKIYVPQLPRQSSMSPLQHDQTYNMYDIRSIYIYMSIAT